MTSENIPFVSVVVPHRGNLDPLLACLAALRDQTYGRENFEIIVSLNDDAFTPLPNLPSCADLVVWEPEGFSYAARNAALAKASGTIVAFTDSDTTASPTWLAEGVRFLDRGFDLCAGKIELTFKSVQHSPAASYEKVYSFDQRKNARAGFSTTANLFVKKHVIDTIGFFPSEAVTGADFEWTKCATKTGFLLDYCPTAAVFHPARETWVSLMSKTRRKANFHRLGSSHRLNMRELVSRMIFRYLSQPSLERVRSATFGELTSAFAVNMILLFATTGLVMQNSFSVRKRRKHKTGGNVGL
ncbi:glycosyltransferase [Pontimonas sp.]|nr:glycosyltransferase [Pontimonas sp.]